MRCRLNFFKKNLNFVVKKKKKTQKNKIGAGRAGPG